MPDLNQNLYNASYSHLKSAEVPEQLADAVSRIVSTDIPGENNLGRNSIDTELCQQVAIVLNSNSKKED